VGLVSEEASRGVPARIDPAVAGITIFAGSCGRRASAMWFPYFKGRPTDHIIRYTGGRPPV